MTKVFSLKIKNEIFQKLQEITKQLKIPRNTYINEALDFYNGFNRRKILGKKLLRESLLVRKSEFKRNGQIRNKLRGSVLDEKDIIDAIEADWNWRRQKAGELDKGPI